MNRSALVIKVACEICGQEGFSPDDMHVFQDGTPAYGNFIHHAERVVRLLEMEGIIGDGETLHEALAGLGITSAKDDRCDWNTRSLYWRGEYIGHFEAHAAWGLVNDLRPREPSSLAETFATMAANAA